MKKSTGFLTSDEMYAARGIGIFLVVVGHLVVPFGDAGRIYAFHMPLFYFLAGMLISDKKSIVKSFKGAVTSIIPYYLVTIFLLICVTVFLTYFFDVKLKYTSLYDYKTYFVYPFISNSQHVDLFIVGWFLLAFIPARLISHIFIVVFNRIILMSLVLLTAYIGMDVLPTLLSSNKVWYVFYLSQIFTAIAFMVSGYLVQNILNFTNSLDKIFIIAVLYAAFIMVGADSLNMAWARYPNYWIQHLIVGFLGIFIILFLSKHCSKYNLLKQAGYYSRAIMSYHILIFVLLSVMFACLGYAEYSQVHKFYVYNKKRLWPLYAALGFLVPLYIALFIDRFLISKSKAKGSIKVL